MVPLPQGQVDLGDQGQKWGSWVEPSEHPDERNHRLSEAKEEGKHRRRRDMVVHSCAAVVVLATFGIAIFLLVHSSAAAPERDFAEKLITSILSALLGYFVGKSQTKSE